MINRPLYNKYNGRYITFKISNNII